MLQWCIYVIFAREDAFLCTWERRLSWSLLGKCRHSLCLFWQGLDADFEVLSLRCGICRCMILCAAGSRCILGGLHRNGERLGLPKPVHLRNAHGGSNVKDRKA